MRLTKKKLRALDLGLTLDDVLYEKFRRLNERLVREELRIGKKKLIKAVHCKKGAFCFILPIISVESCSDGLLVYVDGSSL
jgi:hypothetical protein